MRLTKRQRHIVSHLAVGCSNKVVARNLCISLLTVHKHRQNIYRRLGINNLAKLTRYALEKGIIKLNNEQASLPILTPREEQVARLVIEGLTNQQIANELGVKYGTIRKHRENIYAKYNVNNVSQLAIHKIQ